MTLEECITDCEQVMFGAQMMKQTEVYDYNRQLAEWLRKLKAYESDAEICKYCTHTHDSDYCNICKHNTILVDYFDLEVNADDA